MAWGRQATNHYPSRPNDGIWYPYSNPALWNGDVVTQTTPQSVVATEVVVEMISVTDRDWSCQHVYDLRFSVMTAKMALQTLETENPYDANSLCRRR